MPQLTLNHACVADVLPDPEQPTRRIVKLNVDEEDFFDMLDHVNPKNIIKYLDMRQIPHRDAINIVVPRVEFDARPRIFKRMRHLIERNDKRCDRAQKLMESYYGH